MITAILAIIVIGCLFYTMIPNVILIGLCMMVSTAFMFLPNHKHVGFLEIDMIAQKSRLNNINPSLKFWTVILLMFLCVSSSTPLVGFLLAVCMMIFIVIFGGMGMRDYLSFLTVPVMFLLMSGLALLFEYGTKPIGVINLPLLEGYFYVSHNAQLRTALVMSKAIGSISCLYLLSLSTTMSEIIAVLRKAHVPEIIIELMYLIYRYIFVLFDMYRIMKNAAKSRLGFVDFFTSVKTTGQIYGHLLARSYRKALSNFDAMESRCYDGEIRFLEHSKELTVRSVIFAGIIVSLTLGMTILT